MTQLSLICTVKNEADTIAALLDSMLAQSRQPDEIVVNDCGSTDATAAIVQSYIDRGAAIRLVHGGFNISSGRNNAIMHAQGHLIASTDAGLALDREWLERIVAPLEADQADLVAGFYQAAPRSDLETAIGATNYPLAAEVDPSRFLAAGQSVAFRKVVWETVGGYPEWLDHCEDLVFDQAATAAGFRSTTVLDAVVHFQPRSSFRALFRQYFFYARGDGVANLWPLRQAIRYATYFGLLLLLRNLLQRPWLGVLLGLGLAGYTRKPYRRLWRATKGWAFARRLKTLSLPPMIRVVGDVAKMVGYPVGWLVRLRKFK
ncbi:glycosyltransferase [Herpetosiphon sp. NSE202]|uniref:glycosyltransferase n=1 Tax=Herpetosiphon sp. NSE202 TaxID=3351349 RepID=UPI00363EF657